MDRNKTASSIAVSEELAGSMVFALNPLTYAEGMLFAQVGGGQIQAQSGATTLKTPEISEETVGVRLLALSRTETVIFIQVPGILKRQQESICTVCTDKDPSAEMKQAPYILEVQP